MRAFERAATGALSARGAPRPVRGRSEAAAEGDRRRKAPVLQPRTASTRSRTEGDRENAVGGVGRRLARPFDLRGLSSVPADCGRAASAAVRRRPGAGGESVGHLSDPS